MPINKILKDAGRRQRTVKIKTSNRHNLITTLEVEPYHKRIKGKETLLFCLNVESFTYLSIPITTILEAELTSRSFKPRFPIAL